ncbi:hypothetical protein TNCV_205061 [Trichonephila clavipes]|nr:hypothetical protein TNCV_205061 [Trichonephila clavipes]
MDLVLKENYLNFNGSLHRQTKGLPQGGPASNEKQKAAALEEKQKAVVVAQQREREYELEKMKIQLEMQKLLQAPVTSQQLENSKLELNRIIPRFNSMENEMGLYLTIFERQAKFLNLPGKTWDSIPDWLIAT